MPRAELSVADPRVIEVETAYSEKELIKLIPGTRWDAESRVWSAPLAWSTCVTLRGVFGDTLVVGPRLDAAVWEERRARVDPALALRDLDEWPADRPDPGFDPRTFSFQRVGAYFLCVAGDALLGDEMGAGKTVQVVQALDLLGPDALPTLVVCPNSVKTNWHRHVLEWLPDAATPYVVAGGAVGRRKIIETARRDPRAVVIVNIEAVRLLSRLAPYGSIKLLRCRECDPRHGDETVTATRCEVHRKELNEFGFRTVVLDEAHRTKDPKSKQTRAVWAVMHGPSVTRRWALTGTPVANHVGDLWSVMHGVAPREYPTRSRFVDRYALQSWNNFGGLDIVGVNPLTRDEFFRTLDPRFRRMMKVRVLPQLPPKVYETRYVELSPKQLRAYREIEEGAITQLDDGEVLVAANNLVARTRMIQFSSAYAEIEPVTQRVRLAEPSPKVDELIAVIDDVGGRPLAACAESRQLIELASARLTKLGVPHDLIVGGMSEDERRVVLDRFADGRTRVVLFTMQAGGTGVDGLQHADVLVRLQRSWSMLLNAQTEDRVHRVGSERHRSVTIIDVVAGDTVEETVQLPRLAEKRRRLDEITRDGEWYRDAALVAEYNRVLNSDLGEP